ncbi:fatty acyl-AMP ligase [Fodinicola feengrottensis]|uniref:fatty acyl-AMP ligase n=1 Tax=Fodinicola feengrottensis TaxID=435914 RepID=UPI0013D440F1|nr:fatty acyl-AMP ligase [Fodinicola feengrottensis]
MVGDSAYLNRFRQQVERVPERVACGFLGDGENLTATLTYGELDVRARTIADQLQGRLAAGSRAILQAEPHPDFAAAFFSAACMRA